MDRLKNILITILLIGIAIFYTDKKYETMDINEECPRIISYVTTDETCPPGKNGSIEMVTQNAYYFNWSSGHTGEDIYNLRKGSYEVTISNFSGCDLVYCFKIDSEDCPDCDPLNISITAQCN